jgi:hypothetical protein
VRFGPPALPVYEQPVCPGDGYIWTPGYWAWGDDDYYWVPGTWVTAPEVGFLWTPPYWAFADGAYAFYDGYWGPHVGFYGGIDYGFGYFGVGFVGGRWDGGHFFYNREVTNINVVNIHNVYVEKVNREVRDNRVSYNGGPGGVEARPRPEEEAAARDRHLPRVSEQTRNAEAARGNREFRANENHGKPPIGATGRPGEFSGHETTPVREAGAPYNPNRGGELRGGAAGKAGHAKDLPPMERPAAPNTGDAKLDKKYQQQQDKVFAKQQQDRQKLEQRQEKEDQQVTKQNANDAKRQQVEQRHAQQTQQMQQRHTTEMQHVQARQAPPKHK